MATPNLFDLAVEYFRRRGYKIEKSVRHEGFSGLPRSFDLIVSRDNERHPVWIRDWKRTVGINIVINMDRASDDTGHSTPILVADKFSDHAKAYANRRAIRLITKSEIVMTLR